MINLLFSPCTGSTAAALIQLLHTITSLLDTRPYVIVYALDFSKAFDSVRHSSVLNTFSKMNLLDNMYNWIENLFRDCTLNTLNNSTALVLATKFPNSERFWQVSYKVPVWVQLRTLLQHLTCIQLHLVTPQWSSLTASYVVTASDLHPITPVKSAVKFTDSFVRCYSIWPASSYTW